ncbi:unnamed protein product [Laminaria digitata]
MVRALLCLRWRPSRRDFARLRQLRNSLGKRGKVNLTMPLLAKIAGWVDIRPPPVLRLGCGGVDPPPRRALGDSGKRRGRGYGRRPPPPRIPSLEIAGLDNTIRSPGGSFKWRTLPPPYCDHPPGGRGRARPGIPLTWSAVEAGRRGTLPRNTEAGSGAFF